MKQWRRVRVGLMAVTIWSLSQTLCLSQSELPAAPSIEDLNLRGADAFMPPFDDSVIDSASMFRRGMADHGLAIRTIAGEQYTQNTLASPVAPSAQVYVGQRPVRGP